MKCVLDASALLAFLQREPGEAVVREALQARPEMTSVNLGEVAHRLMLTNRPRGEIEILLSDLKILIHPVDRELALEAGYAAVFAKPYGLSFADRICLMLAKRLNLPTLTSDRRMADASDALGVKVELIR